MTKLLTFIITFIVGNDNTDVTSFARQVFFIAIPCFCVQFYYLTTMKGGSEDDNDNEVK